MRCPILLALVFGVTAVAAAHAADVAGDAYLTGYARAALEREFHVGAASLRVEGGVVKVDAVDLGAADRVRIVQESYTFFDEQSGVEFRSPWPGPGAMFQPIAALDIQYRAENDCHADVSLRAGVEFQGLLAGRNLQPLVESFRGHSPNGQFYKQKIDYIGLGLHFNF